MNQLILLIWNEYMMVVGLCPFASPCVGRQGVLKKSGIQPPRAPNMAGRTGLTQPASSGPEVVVQSSCCFDDLELANDRET